MPTLPPYLQSSTVTPVPCRATESVVRGSAYWRSRQVEVTPLLTRPLKHGEMVSGDELEEVIGEKYGNYIQDYLRSDIAGKKLDDRVIKQLEAKASGRLRLIRKQNRDSVDTWIQQGLAESAFETASPFTWRSLPDYEKENLKEEIQFTLNQHKGYLEYREAEDIAKDCVRHFQSHFSMAAPTVSAFLSSEMIFDQPILSGHLSLWAQQHFDPEKRPGRPLEHDDGFFEAGVYISEFDKNLLCNADACTRMTNQLLLGSVLEKLESESFDEQLGVARSIGVKLMKNLKALSVVSEHVPDALKQAIKEDLVDQLHTVVAHINELKAMKRMDPLSEERWQAYKEVEIASAIEALDTEIQQQASVTKPDLTKIGALKRLRQEWLEYLDDVSEGVDEDFPSDEAGSVGLLPPPSDAKEFTADLILQLKKAGLGKRAKKKLALARSRVLSSDAWDIVETEIGVQIAGKPMHFKSVLVPASQMKIDPEGMDIFPVDYEDGGRPSTATTESEHAVNLGQTILKRAEAGRERVAFKGLRSGTLSAYGIKDSRSRREATEERARELVIAALKQCLDDHPEYNQPGVVVPLRLLSTSLLSADTFRHMTHIHDDELKMQREQVAALRVIQQELARGQTLCIKQPDGSLQEYSVRLQLVTANYGVNSISLSGLQTVMRPWGEAKKVNSEGLRVLLGSPDPFDKIGGWSGEYLASAAADKDKAIVRQLVEQIRDLHVSGDYRREGNDAYKMVERIQYLAYKLGVVTHINCKSGKDRTGEADAAIKRFAAEIEALGYVPDPRKPMVQEDRILSQKFLFETGNIQWQQMNINLPGYKTKVGKNRVGAFVYNMAHKAKFHLK